jgi:hypothetical protein
MDIAEAGTALAIPERTELVALFKTEGGLDPLIARIEAEVRSHVPDVTTKKGRDAIASLAYKVARSKTTLDDAGKMLTDEQRKQIAVVDAARRAMRDRLDALKDEARKPLDAWETAEQERVAALKARMVRLRDAAPPEETPEAFAALIARVEATAIDDTWQEFTAEAAQVKDATLKRLRDAADLIRLRAEAAARAEADRIAAERAAEAERQRLAAEAEAQRKADEERREAERAAQIERDRQEAAARAAREVEERAAEQAEKDRQVAAAREAELQRQLDAQKAETERAAQAERDRLAEQQRAAQEAEERRAADVAHRARIRKEIIAAIETCGGAGIVASLVADAILEGKVPHVKAVL